MDLTFNFENNATPKLIAAQLRMSANLFEGVTGRDAAKTQTFTQTVTADDVQNTPPVKTKPAKKDAEETFDLGFDADAEETEAPAITLKEVVAGFKAYAKENGRDKAGKILAKYKVKSVQDLPETVYAKVLKEIEV